MQFADAECGTVDDIVDLATYPIHHLESTAGSDLIEHVRTTLAVDGCVSLRGFLLPQALKVSQTEIAVLASKTPVRVEEGNVYGTRPNDHELLADDPRRVMFKRTVGHVTRDQIAPDAVMSRLYACPDFKAFIAASTNANRAFEYADPLAGLIVTVVPPGGELSWHYDTNEFVVSVMMQEPVGGGLFQYCPQLRRPGDENLEGLGQLLRGEAADRVQTRRLRPGDLQIFAGRYSLHQVTRVTGDRQRHVAVLSYSNRPGVIGPVDRTRAVYGRVTEAHLVAEEFGSMAPDGLIL